MKKLPPLLVYTVLRLLAFLVPLAVLWFFFPVFREYWWLAALFSALMGMSISLVFLRAPLSAASRRIHEKRSGSASGARDEDVEDAELDDPASGDRG